MTLGGGRFPGLAGRVAVITGASGAIGRAIALALAGQQVAVAVSGRRNDALEHLAQRINHDGGRATAIPADVTDRQALERLRNEVQRRLGPVDLVAAVAGGLGDPMPLLQLSSDRWRETIEVNLTSVFSTMQIFLPGMLARGRGAMVTVSSTSGRETSAVAEAGQTVRASPAYAAAKAALLWLTRHAAAEVASSHVRINAIAPGAVRNERFDRAPETVVAEIARHHPLGRIGEPEDVAEAALFLLSDAASWITGATLDINGGRVMV